MSDVRTSGGPVGWTGVLAAAGPGARRVPGATHPGEHYLVARGTDPGTVVVVLPAHDLPGASGVWGATRVRLHGPVPGEVAHVLTGGGRVLGFAGEGTPDGAGEWVPLGVLRPVMWSGVHDGPLDLCELELDDPLAPGALQVVRPPAPAERPVDPAAWLALLPGDPVTALERFATDWYRDLPVTLPGASRARAATAVPDWAPAPLARFHRLAAHEPRLLGTQDRMLSLPAPPPDAPVAIGEENQGAWTWTLDPAELRRARAGGPHAEALLTVSRDDGTGPVREDLPLGAFLLSFALFEAAFAAPYDAWSAWVSPQDVAAVVAPLTRVPLDGPGRAARSVHVGPDLVVVCDPVPGGAALVAGARHRAPLARLAALGCDWDSFGG